MMKHLKFSIIVVLAWMVSSCVFKLDDYTQVAGSRFLNIEGGINDQLIQQTIKITYSSATIGSNSFIEPILNAKVYITDENNEKIAFQQLNKDGTYQTAQNVQGKAGKIYTLHIETADGKIYQSSPETMPNPVAIDNIYDEATLVDKYPQTSSLRGGFDVYIDFKDSPKAGEFYLWTWKNYRKIIWCDLCQGRYNTITHTCTFVNSSQLLRYDCLQDCWDITQGNDIQLLSDGIVNGQAVKRAFIYRVPYLIMENSSNRKFFIEGQLKSLTQNAYNYYSGLQKNGQSGTIFDVPTLTRFNLNMKSLTNPDEKILGIFEVAATNFRSLNIDLNVDIPGATRFQVSYPGQECTPFPCTTNCDETLLRTRLTPSGWQK